MLSIAPSVIVPLDQKQIQMKTGKKKKEMPSQPEKDSAPIDVVDLSSSSDDEDTDRVMKEEEKEKEKASHAPSLVPSHQGQSVESRSFWRAGAYDVVSKPTATSQGQLEHARVHPKFLHSNATSHKWAFGAIAELLDNAVDEICHGATFVKVDRIYNARDDSPTLLFQDDGGGMDPECMRQCMSLGYSSKKTNTTIGQYGNGFKTSTMRLGADAIVFSRAIRGSRTTQSIGLLSYTFLRRTGQDDIIVPMIDFEIFEDQVQPMIYSSQDDWTNNLEIILGWSPFTSKEELLLQFEDIGPHGTKVIVYNLWLNDDGVLELDFDDDQEDIRLRDEATNGGLSKSQKGLVQSHISYRLRYSLRAYASILYLRKFTDFHILLRGKPVQQLNLEDELKFSKVIPYKPQLGITSREVTVETTIGFLKEAPILKVYGFNIYHKNRLIMPFWKVIHEGSSRGKGVVGVLEANFIEPAHDKQDFERTALFIRLELRLKQMLLDYWKRHCHLLGYHSSANSHNMQDIPADLPSIGHATNLQEVPFDQPVIGLAANLQREFPIEEPVIGLAANFHKELPTGQPIIGLAATSRINSVPPSTSSQNMFGTGQKQVNIENAWVPIEGNGHSDTMASAGHHETDFSQWSNAEVAQSEKGYFKELTSLDGSGSTLVDKICEENIQLFMRCEEHRQKETDLKQMIDKLEAELEETRKKSAQLRSNLENQRQQRHRD